MESELAPASAMRSRRARSSALRAAWRVGLIFAGSCVFLVVWIVVKSTARSKEHLYELAARWTGHWARYCCWAAGFRVTASGSAPPNGTLIAPNHLGYADVLPIGSQLPCFFVAKVDVESWPFIGTLFTISHNIGVPRARVKSLIEATLQITDRLRAKQSVCVFLEGTSSGGKGLLPFYPPLVQPAIDAGAFVTPVAVRWVADDTDIDIGEDIAYWREEHTFGPHAWRLLGFKGIRADIRFGEPIPSDGKTRKSLAVETRDAVAALLGLAIGPVAPAP